MDDTNKVRLINAYELEEKIKARYGLTACGIIETIRECEEVKAIPTNIAGEDMEKRINDTYNRRFEDKAKTSA